MEKALSEKSPEKSTHKAYSSSKLRIAKNLMTVCFNFFFLYLPFYSLADVQGTINADYNVGVISQSILFATSIFSSLFLSRPIIENFGCKTALVICSIAYVPYFAANAYPHTFTFFPASVLLGIGSGPLWATSSVVINEVSVSYAALCKDEAGEVASKFMSIFFIILKSSLIWGNLLSFYILKPAGSQVDSEYKFFNSSVNDLRKPFRACGATFCGGMNENMLPPALENRYIITGSYVLCALMSALIVLLFLDQLDESSDKRETKTKFYSRAVTILRHLKNRDQLLLVPITIFNGMEQAFVLGEYSKVSAIRIY